MRLSGFRSALAIAATLATAAPATAQTARGQSFDYIQRTRSVSPAGTQEAVAVRAHVTVDGDGRMRMDIAEAAASPMWASGDYLVASASGTIVVSPSRKEFLDLGADFGMSEMAGVMQSSGVSMKSIDGTFAFDSLTDTPVIGGLPTRHYRMVRTGSMSMTSAQGTMDMPYTSETDYFVTGDAGPAATALTAFSGGATGLSGMLTPKALEQIRSAAAAMKGIALRTVTRTTTSMMGMSSEATQTLEIENLKAADVPAIVATPPAGYAKGSLTARLKAMTGG